LRVLPGFAERREFCVQLINALTGAELVPVPYTGAAPAIAALRGGHIEGVVLSLGALSNHINSGAFRGLVASSRFPEFADIPPMRDLGYREELSASGLAFSRLQESPRTRGRPSSARSNKR
jgi:tripartite-type tricarboxylate transporter receptor subunit TctC